MIEKVIYSALTVAIIAWGVSFYLRTADQDGATTACPADARLCPDGSSVGRSGPNCEFASCPSEPVPADVLEHIEVEANRILLDEPKAGSYITSPLTISGQARGQWYFEASFPILLVNWDGLIIAEYYATAQGDWMTEEFVPFTSQLTFESPYKEGDPDFMKRGALILQRSNASGLPEHDAAIEVPVWFTPAQNE